MTVEDLAPVRRSELGTTGRERRRTRDGHVPGESGLWVLILGDMTIFGVFFAVYTYDRATNWQLFTASQQTLNGTIGLTNTGLLLLSSLLVVLGVRAVRGGEAARAPKFFALAWVCGLGFAANKAIEYTELLHAGHTPATNGFYTYYFVFTGIHATHLLVGMCVLALMWFTTRRPSATSRTAFVEGCASYWHLVDVLWIVLFPLLYLA